MKSPFPFTLPSETEERRQSEFGAFTEWASDLDRAYDALAQNNCRRRLPSASASGSAEDVAACRHGFD
jgi:hypothetical protein